MGLGWVAVAWPGLAQAQFSDTFDTINPAWMTDRYEPAGFAVASFQGDNRLQITIDQTGSAANRPSPAYSAALYNTQGEERPTGIAGEWTLSAEVYVSSAYATTSGQLIKTDLWGHAGTSLNNGDYAIFGFTNDSPTDPLNPAALDRAFRFQVFTGTTNDPTSWANAGVPSGFTFDAWHSLKITSTGSTADYLLDGVEIYRDPIFAGANLQGVYLQAYNFGQVDGNGLNSYSVYWDNALAVVPEPGAFACVTGIGVLLIGWTQSRTWRRAP